MENTSAWLNWLGGRTFVLTVGCGFATTILCWFGKIDGSVYALTIGSTVGAYIGANAVQKVQQIKADATTP